MIELTGLYRNSHPSAKCREAMGFNIDDYLELVNSSQTDPDNTILYVIRYVWGDWSNYILGKNGLLPKLKKTTTGSTELSWVESPVGIKSIKPHYKTKKGTNLEVACDALAAATFLSTTYTIFIHQNEKASKPKNYLGEELGTLDNVQDNNQIIEHINSFNWRAIKCATMQAQIKDVTPFNVEIINTRLTSNMVSSYVNNFFTKAGVFNKDSDSVTFQDLTELGRPSEVMHNIITFIAYATRDMEKDIKFVTYRNSWENIATLMCDTLGIPRIEENENIIYFWEPLYVLDHYDEEVSYVHLQFCFDLLSSALDRKVFHRKDNVFTIGENTYTLESDGVFDKRERRVQNIAYSVSQYLEENNSMTLVGEKSLFTTRAKHEMKEDEVHLAYNYSSFLFALLNCASALVNSGSSHAQNFRKELDNLIPYDSEEESGGVYKGLRKFYNLDTGKHFGWQGVMPVGLADLKFTNISIKHKESYEHIPMLQKCKLDMSRISTIMLRKYNLGIMHKGDLGYFNAQFILFRLDHLQENEKVAYLTYLVKQALDKDLVEGLRDLFPELSFATVGQDQLLIDIVIKEFAVALFDKLSKITKRASLAVPKYAQGIDSQHEVTVTKNGVDYTYSIDTSLPVVKDSALIRFSPDNYDFEENAWIEETPVNVVNAVYLPMASGIAGVAYRLAKHMPGFITPSSWSDNINPINIKGYECFVGDFECITDAKFDKGSIDFTTAQTDFGGSVPVNGLQVERDDVIFSFLYLNSDKEICRYSVVAPDDVILTELSWKSTNRGNRQIKLKYFTIDGLDGAIKIRGGTKALLQMPKTGLGSIYNHLTLNDAKGYDQNGNVIDVPALTGFGEDERPVDLVIPSDCDKSKDGMAWIIPDVISETLVHCEMNESLKDFNVQYFGIEDPYHLVWLEALAALGVYDIYLAWFVQNFGRTVWLHNLDLPNSCIKGLKEMFANRAVVENKFNPDKDSWMSTTVARLETELGLTDHGFPEDATVVVSGFNLYNEIYVFYSDEQGDHMWQRTFGFGGHSGKYVRLAYKPELCSVRQSSGFTGLIGSAARVLASGLGSIPSNNKLATRLFENTAVLQKIAIFRAMGAKKPIMDANDIQLPKINFKQDGRINTAAIMRLLGSEENIAKAKQGQLTLTDIVEPLSEVVINLGPINLYVPAIHDQDKGFNPDSLGGTICQLFSMVLSKYDNNAGNHNERTANMSGYGQMVARITTAIETLADIKKSEKFWKKMNQGRLSAHCKAMGGFGVPIDEVWVTVSNRKNSFYQYLKACFKAQGYKGSLNDQYVLMSRSPLPFLAKLKIKLIYADGYSLNIDTRNQSQEISPIIFDEESYIDNIQKQLDEQEAELEAIENELRERVQQVKSKDANFKCMSANSWQVLVSAFTCYISGGDFDGDNYCFTPVLHGEHEDFPLLTYELIMETIKLRTGKDALSKQQGAYIPDHFIPKRWKKAQIFKPTCVKLSCLVLMERGEYLLQKYGLYSNQNQAKLQELERKGFNKMMSAACENHQKDIGLAHGFATIAEAYCAITRTCRNLFSENAVVKREEHWSNQDIALAINEVYEAAPLGGLSWPAFDLLRLLEEVYGQGFSDEEYKIPSLIQEAGLNVTRANEIVQIAAYAGSCNKFQDELNVVKPEATDNKDLKYGDADTLLTVYAQLIHIIGRATFNPFVSNKGDGNGALNLIKYITLCEPSLRDAMAEKCVVVDFIERFIRYVMPSYDLQICNILGISNKVTAPVTIAINPDLTTVVRPEVGYAQSHINGYDLVADGRFSENCVLQDGRTIGQAFHNDIKGYSSVNWRDNLYAGINPEDERYLTMSADEQYTYLCTEYSRIWQTWAKENTALMYDLAHRSNGLVLTYPSEGYVDFFNPAYLLDGIIRIWIRKQVPVV